MNIVNLSIQVVPVNQEGAYKIIDQAIGIIEASGYKYRVTPFNTVIEGPFEELMNLISKVKDKCQAAGAKELLLNIQFHMINNQDVYLSDKTKKFI